MRQCIWKLQVHKAPDLFINASSSTWAVAAFVALETFEDFDVPVASVDAVCTARTSKGQAGATASVGTFEQH